MRDFKQAHKQNLADLLRRAADALDDGPERGASKAQQQLFDFDHRSSWQDAMDTPDGA
jgi:hypothetical protein